MRTLEELVTRKMETHLSQQVIQLFRSFFQAFHITSTVLEHGLAILEAVYCSPFWWGWVTFLNTNQPSKTGYVGESHLRVFEKSAIEIVGFASRAAIPRDLNCIAYKFNKYPFPTPNQPYVDH